MRRSIPPSRVHQHLIWLLATSCGSLLQAYCFPLAEVQSTQRLVDDSRVLDASAPDCKTASSLVIAVVPLSVKHTHGATRSYVCSRKDSRKEALTWGSAPSAEPSLNQVRLGQRSRTREGDLETVRERDDC